MTRGQKEAFEAVLSELETLGMLPDSFEELEALMNDAEAHEGEVQS
jgi:hypothetical protein